jgi:TonB-dependent receptor
VNDSPRERGRVLLKRNPIASEYQDADSLGWMPGATADGEGVDFRAFFPLPGIDLARPQKGVELQLNMQGRRARWVPGGALRWSELLGDHTSVQLQLRQTRGERLIEHYQAAWRRLAGGATSGDEAVYFLDRPRFSWDSFETTNSLARWRLEHRTAGDWRIAYEGSWTDYEDTFYRNRMEYQFAGGLRAETLRLDDAGTSVVAAESVNARIRRYFGNTVTQRRIVRHQLEANWERSDRAFSVVAYHGSWRNNPLWDGWNFHDRGLHLAYGLADPQRPTVDVLNGVDLFDLSGSRFNDFRIYETLTEDIDRAVRVDFDQRFMPGGQPLWISVGGQWRAKERVNDYDQRVHFPGAVPFALDAVASTGAPRTILDGHYRVPRGVDPARARAFYEAHRETHFRFDLDDTLLSSAQNRFRSEESVGAAYLRAYQNRGPWRWELGLRQEWTNNETLGVNTGPREILEERPGQFLQQLEVAGETYAVGDGVGGTFMKEVPGSRRYADLLPSAELRYDPGEAWSVSVSFHQALMRPQYFDIVEYRRVSVPTRTISEGNPGLEPTLIDSFALTFRWQGERLGAWIFQLYETRVRDFYYGATSIELIGGDDYSVNRVENGENGWIRGFQVVWNHSLDTRSLGLEATTFSLAYTFSESEAVLGKGEGLTILLPERSRHLLQANFSTRLGGWSLSSDFSYQSKALDDVGETRTRDGYRGEVIQWSQTIGRRLSERWRLRLTLSNLLNHPERGYEGVPVRATQNQYSFYLAQAVLQSTF